MINDLMNSSSTNSFSVPVLLLLFYFFISLVKHYPLPFSPSYPPVHYYLNVTLQEISEKQLFQGTWRL